MKPAGYFVCSTPRTGSTYLCSLLTSTGVAGRPQSYFREPDLGRWAAQWGVPTPGSTPDWFQAYAQAALIAGRAGGDVFGARVMWGSMEPIVAGLRAEPNLQPTRGRAILERAFGPTEFVWLHRENRVAQAISRYRAERSHVWHVTEEERSNRETPSVDYDFDAIHAFAIEARDHHRAWASWFEQQGVTPLVVTYEELTRDPLAEVDRVLAHLGVERPPGGRPQSPNRKMAGARSLDWEARYRNELAARGEALPT